MPRERAVGGIMKMKADTYTEVPIVKYSIALYTSSEEKAGLT